MNGRNPQAFGKVAVLMGGWSPEREVSLDSGRQVLAALQAAGVDAQAVDPQPAEVASLRQQGYARAFNLLHGTGGEDGTVQAALALQGLPYTGSSVMASALAMDKLRSKLLWRGAGLPTPEFVVATSALQAAEAVQSLGLPLFVKPVAQGSSVGMSKVSEAAQIQAAFELASAHGKEVLLEAFVAGREYTCAILDGRALPLVQIVAAGEYYDYHAKYLSDQTRYHCPCDLPAELQAAISAQCLQAFAALGCSGWGRVDLMLDGNDQHWLIEANTVPGMTSHSLVPMAARAAGMDFSQLCLRILETTMTQAPA